MQHSRGWSQSLLALSLLHAGVGQQGRGVPSLRALTCPKNFAAPRPRWTSSDTQRNGVCARVAHIQRQRAKRVPRGTQRHNVRTHPARTVETARHEFDRVVPADRESFAPRSGPTSSDSDAGGFQRRVSCCPPGIHQFQSNNPMHASTLFRQDWAMSSISSRECWRLQAVAPLPLLGMYQVCKPSAL